MPLGWNKQIGCGSKNRYQNGTLVSGNTDQNLGDPSCLILSHTQLNRQAPQRLRKPSPKHPVTTTLPSAAGSTSSQSSWAGDLNLAPCFRLCKSIVWVQPLGHFSSDILKMTQNYRLEGQERGGGAGAGGKVGHAHALNPHQHVRFRHAAIRHIRTGPQREHFSTHDPGAKATEYSGAKATRPLTDGDISPTWTTAGAVEPEVGEFLEGRLNMAARPRSGAWQAASD